MIFSGTLRFNLDPLDQYTDSEIWSCLNAANLRPLVESMPERLNTRLSPISAASLSMGERQLICLVRAMLKKSKIVVIDEATANIDPETEKLIHHVIDEYFAESTVLTIAHRLTTIADSNRVVLLSNGKIQSIDEPSDLLHNPDTEFFKYTRSLSNVDRETILKMVLSATRKKPKRSESNNL